MSVRCVSQIQMPSGCESAFRMRSLSSSSFGATIAKITSAFGDQKRREDGCFAGSARSVVLLVDTLTGFQTNAKKFPDYR